MSTEVDSDLSVLESLDFDVKCASDGHGVAEYSFPGSLRVFLGHLWISDSAEWIMHSQCPECNKVFITPVCEGRRLQRIAVEPTAVMSCGASNGCFKRSMAYRWNTTFTPLKETT